MPMKGKHTINYLQYQGVRCVAMSCGGESFSPEGAYDFTWDNVKPSWPVWTRRTVLCEVSEAVMSCGDESFSSGCACGSAWDSVKPMKGKYIINYIQYSCRRWVCLHAQ